MAHREVPFADAKSFLSQKVFLLVLVLSNIILRAVVSTDRMWFLMSGTSKARQVRGAFSSAPRPARDLAASEFFAERVEVPLSLALARARGEWPGRAYSSSIVLVDLQVKGGRCVPLVLAAHKQPFSHCASNSAGSDRSQPSFFELAIASAAPDSKRARSSNQSVLQQRSGRH